MCNIYRWHRFFYKISWLGQYQSSRCLRSAITETEKYCFCLGFLSLSSESLAGQALTSWPNRSFRVYSYIYWTFELIFIYFLFLMKFTRWTFRIIQNVNDSKCILTCRSCIHREWSCVHHIERNVLNHKA